MTQGDTIPESDKGHSGEEEPRRAQMTIEEAYDVIDDLSDGSMDRWDEAIEVIEEATREAAGRVRENRQEEVRRAMNMGRERNA